MHGNLKFKAAFREPLNKNKKTIQREELVDVRPFGATFHLKAFNTKKTQTILTTLHPRRNDYINRSLRIILCNGRTSLHRFYVWDHKLHLPDFLCNSQSHRLHTKFRLSKCNFLTRCGLHEIYAMSRKLIPLHYFLYVCNVLGRRGRPETNSNREKTKFHFWARFPLDVGLFLQTFGVYYSRNTLCLETPEFLLWMEVLAWHIHIQKGGEFRKALP